jgi:hypothetical protein
MIGCTTDVRRKKLDVPSIFRFIRNPLTMTRSARTAQSPAPTSAT